MKISEQIIDSAIKIHKTLGPGLLESVYQNCLAYELERRNFSVSRENIVPIRYENILLESGFRADLIVNDQVLIEVKSVEKLQPIHKAQILTYLKLTPFSLGLLINFGEILLKNGLHRFADGVEANDL